MKNILITGASGFIGEKLLQILLTKTTSRIVLAVRERKKYELFEGSENIELLDIDIEKNLTIPQITKLKKIDQVIHLAWDDLDHYNSFKHVSDHFPNHLRFISTLIEQGVSDFTIIGTCLETGLREGNHCEDDFTRPVTYYGMAKDFLRQSIEKLANEKKIRLKWVRLFYMYGEGQRKKSLLAQLQAALDRNENEFPMSGGEQLRDYLHVQKVAEYIALIAMDKEASGIINCCSGRAISIRKLVEDYLVENGGEIQLKLGVYPYPEYEPMAFWGDNSKLKKIAERNNYRL